MKKPFLPFIAQAASVQAASQDRARILAAAISMAVACRIKITPVELDVPTKWYTENVEPLAMRIASEFNEATIIDMTYARALMKQFWLQRYDLIYTCPRLVGVADFFYEYFGLTTHFSEQDLDFMQTYRIQIASIYTVVCPVVEEIMEATGKSA